MYYFVNQVFITANVIFFVKKKDNFKFNFLNSIKNVVSIFLVLVKEC